MNRTALPRLAAARRKGRWRLMLMLPAMLCLLAGLDAARSGPARTDDDLILGQAHDIRRCWSSGSQGP